MVDEKICIITPVYNAERYLERTISSVLNQNVSDYEWYLIDDGSSDKSGDICDQVAKKNKQIHVIHQNNQGVSVARNRGLDNCNSKYVIFLDADDYLSADAISTRINALKGKDMLITDYCEYEESMGQFISSDREFFNHSCSADQAVEYLFAPGKMGYQGYLWNKMFLFSIIRDNHIRFREDIAYNEDRLFIFQYLCKCKDVSIIADTTYYYVHNNDSKMGKIRQQKYDPSMLTEIKAYNIMKNHLLEDRKRAYYYCCYDYIFAINRLIALNPSDDVTKILIEEKNKNIKDIVFKAKGHCFLKIKIRAIGMLIGIYP